MSQMVALRGCTLLSNKILACSPLIYEEIEQVVRSPTSAQVISAYALAVAADVPHHFWFVSCCQQVAEPMSLEVSSV